MKIVIKKKEKNSNKYDMIFYGQNVKSSEKLWKAKHYIQCPAVSADSNETCGFWCGYQIDSSPSSSLRK